MEKSNKTAKKSNKTAKKSIKGNHPILLGDDLKVTPIKKILKDRQARKDPVPGFTVKDKIKARKAVKN
jgi:hypothetical protein